MKRIMAGLIFLMAAAASWAAALVQHNTAASGSVSSLGVTYTSAQYAGDLNVITVNHGDNVLITAVSDSTNGAYTLAAGPTYNGVGMGESVYYFPGTTAASAGSNTITVTFSAASSFVYLLVSEFSGIAVTNPIDVAVSNTGHSAGPTSGLARTENASDLLYGVANGQGGYSLGVPSGSGFTGINLAGLYNGQDAYNFVSSVGSYFASFTQYSGEWICEMVAFKIIGGPTLTIGYPATSGSTSTDDSGNANSVLTQSATLSQTATLQSLSFYVTTAAGNLVLGIYDATGPGGQPGHLLATASQFTPIVGWNTRAVITPVVLAPGNYWLAYLPSDNDLHFVVSHIGTFYASTANMPLGQLPSVFPSSGSHTEVGNWSFYATLTPGGTPAPSPASTPTPGPLPSGRKPGLTLFGGVQGWHGSSYTPPDPLWKAISAGPASGNQFPSNWWRDDWTFNASQPWTDPTNIKAASDWCKANGVNGPTWQLWYPGKSPGSWNTGNAVQSMTQYLQFYAPYVAPGTYEIAVNEILSNNGSIQNSDPLLVALGGTGKTGWDALIALVKLERQYLPGALLGLNDFGICDYPCFVNQQTAINVYKILHDNGAPLDWLGCEGYWGNFIDGPDGNPEPLSGYKAAIDRVGAAITPYLTGASKGGVIAFTEFTPGGYYCGVLNNGVSSLFPTQQACWQAFLGMFAADPYVFGVTGPWEGFRLSNGFSGANWFYNDQPSNPNDAQPYPENPDCTNDFITPTLSWLQKYVPTIVPGAAQGQR
jgi:hypothetical protein